jgi:hypothetical protein
MTAAEQWFLSPAERGNPHAWMISIGGTATGCGRVAARIARRLNRLSV